MDVETEDPNQMHDVCEPLIKQVRFFKLSVLPLQETSTPTTPKRHEPSAFQVQPAKDLAKSLCLFKFQFACMGVKSFKSCPTLCDPMGCSPPGSSVHGILQARILEWVAMPSSRGSSRPRIELVSLMSPALTGGFFTTSAIWEAQGSVYLSAKWTQ